MPIFYTIFTQSKNKPEKMKSTEIEGLRKVEHILVKKLSGLRIQAAGMVRSAYKFEIKEDIVETERELEEARKRITSLSLVLFVQLLQAQLSVLPLSQEQL